MQPVYNTLPFEQIRPIISKIKKEEITLKADLDRWQQRGAFDNDAALLKEITSFMKAITLILAASPILNLS